jgi:hypothetical protein
MPGYMSGSKRARGTPKIVGLAPSVGIISSVLTDYRIRSTTYINPKTNGLPCPPEYANYRPVLPATGITPRLVLGQSAN